MSEVPRAEPDRVVRRSHPRIGIICPYSMGVWGGVQSQVLGLARSLRHQGVPIQVLAPCDGFPPEPWVTPLGNSIPYAENGSLAPLAPDPAAQLRLLGAVWDERFDLLHLHEPIAPGPTLTALVVKPTPLVGTFHASGSIGPYRWLNGVVRRLGNRLDHRVAVSPEAARTATESLGGEYQIIPNAIEVGRFAAATPRPKEGPTVMFLARHEERKGLRVLLEAAKLMPADVTFWIGGDGDETAELKTEYRTDQRLHWLGAIDDREKEARLAATDVFCVPATGGESFGVVLLEGMAARTPVVASDIPAFREVAGGGRSALLFENGSAPALAAALREALEAGPGVADRVQAGVLRAAEFSMANQARAYMEIYDGVLAGSAGRGR
ncbi:MAG: glycosyltransferase family 4 protein [Acidimicrobiales bacterium]|nr:glycosyltransferase family 4 protein [Acidimicrobiales bacterium]